MAGQLWVLFPGHTTARLAGGEMRFGTHFRFGELRQLATHMPSDSTHLPLQILLHLFSPNEPTRTVLVRAFFQAGQLLPPFPNQRVKSQQFVLEVRCFSLFAIHYHGSECLH